MRSGSIQEPSSAQEKHLDVSGRGGSPHVLHLLSSIGDARNSRLDHLDQRLLALQRLQPKSLALTGFDRSLDQWQTRNSAVNRTAWPCAFVAALIQLFTKALTPSCEDSMMCTSMSLPSDGFRFRQKPGMNQQCLCTCV